MIETGLVYIHVLRPTKRFVGCGAVVEGSYVATCRHVWRLATAPAAQADPDQLPEVEIEYPRSWEGNATIRFKGNLADPCEGAEGPPPDLVLLLPEGMPSGVMALQLAAHDRFEIGNGYAHAGLMGLEPSKPNEVRDIDIKGQIGASTGADGKRQFTGSNPVSYWSRPGTSGAPVFLDGGQ
jgi:hypothetical protein